MTFNRNVLKRSTKNAIADGKTSIILIGLVFLGITLLLNILSMAVSGELAMMKEMLVQTAAGEAVSYAELLEEQTESSGFASFLVMAIDVMSILLGVGFSLACLNTARRKAADIGNLFDGFGFFFRTLSVVLLRYFFVMLATMLYVVPVSLVAGIVAGTGAVTAGLGGETESLAGAVVVFIVGLPLLIPAIKMIYGYRQAVYLLLDEPRSNPMDCLRFSKQLMQGHKMELFKLDLSFIGWGLLTLIPFVSIWVLPYRETCFAGYYDFLMADYRASHPVPEAPQENAPGEEE